MEKFCFSERRSLCRMNLSFSRKDLFISPKQMCFHDDAEDPCAVGRCQGCSLRGGGEIQKDAISC